MGSCVSRHVSKNHNRHQPMPSDVGPPPPPLKKPQDSITTTLPHSGSKDGTFLDSHPWSESDCDDEFYSVDGDNTPRRNSFMDTRLSTGTPLACTLSHGNTGTTCLVKNISTYSRTSTSEISSTEKRKKLFELFQLSKGGLPDEVNFNDNVSVDTKTVSGTGFTSVPSNQFVSDATSVCSSARTSNVSVKSRRNKAHKLIHPVACLDKFRRKNEKDVRSIRE